MKNIKLNKTTFRLFLLGKMPIAFIAGVKLKSMSAEKVEVSVKYGFMNTNPFKSMFWAVEGMAAELSTGVFGTEIIRKSGKNISMLVTKQEAIFTKKAVGKIVFTCNQGLELSKIIDEAITTKESKTITLNSIGIDEKGDQVAVFSFLWSFKLKS